MKKSFFSVCVVALALGGCATTTSQVAPKEVQAYLADKPVETHKLFSKVAVEGERNRVLNLLRAGLASIELGHDVVAARAFDDALLTIETMYGGDEKAAKARSTFTAEDRKTFRGQPYERAMAFYYRGILYLMEGDYENARASFKSGILQDTLAEQEQFRADFALLEYLQGWSSQCNGNINLAADVYVRTKEHNPELVLPEAEDNLLVLADLGHAPIKYAEGKHNELLKVKASGKSYNDSPTFRLASAPESFRNRESVLRQATTQGGREFDVILEGKAQFKENMETTSQVAGAVAVSGLVAAEAGLASGDKDLARIGSGIAAVGGLISLFASVSAQATKPEADTRQWNNLPEVVLYSTYRVKNGSGDPGITGLPGQLRQGGDERCKIAWTKAPSTNLGE